LIPVVVIYDDSHLWGNMISVIYPVKGHAG
jgi:hypothetical protein